MTDDQLMHAFESCTLPPADFNHAAHVRAAWCYLRRYPFDEALSRFSIALQKFATAAGAPGKYDAALTAAYMQLIAERLASCPRDADWDAFASVNAALLRRGSARSVICETLEASTGHADALAAPATNFPPKTTKTRQASAFGLSTPQHRRD